MDRRLQGVSLPVAAAVLAISGAWGCAGRPAADARTLVVWEQEDAAVAPFLDYLFEEFRKLPGNGGVRILRTHYQNEDLRQQFQTASISGSPPDILLSPSDPAGVYSVAGFLLPVDGLFDLSRFNRPVLEAIILEGKTWGVPMSNGNHLMLYYNKRLAPIPPRSTDELEKFCASRGKEVGRSQGLGGGTSSGYPSVGRTPCLALFMGEPYWLMPWVHAFGDWPIDGRSPTLDTAAMRGALGYMLSLKFDKKILPMECDYNCMDSLFKESKAAFAINGDWALPVYEKQLGADLGVARIPMLSATRRWPAPMVSGKYFLLSSGLSGEKLDLARRLVELAVSER
ncbi:MAG: extracellular solute-binding protein, partial [Elusimicrobiota bacterium]